MGEVERGGGEARRKHQGSEKQGVERKQKSQGQKPMLRKVSVQEEVELLCQVPLMITKVFFAVSLRLFLTTSTLLVSDYKQKDSLALRQAMASLPSFEAPAFFANLPPFTSVTNVARETLVQVGWLGEDTWLGTKEGLNNLWSRSGQGLDKLFERTKMVVNDGVRLGGRVVEAVYKKLLVPALKWLQEPRRRGAPPPGHQDGPQKGEQSHGEAGTRRGDGEKTGFPPQTTGPSQAEMEKQMKAKIAATTAYLNKEREHKEIMKKEEKESSMEDF